MTRNHKGLSIITRVKEYTQGEKTVCVSPFQIDLTTIISDRKFKKLRVLVYGSIVYGFLGKADYLIHL